MDFSSFNQLLIAFILLIPIVILSRTVVAGTKYSPILIIVIFGLLMGFLLGESGMATAGLQEFTMVGFMSKVTVVVLIVTFFVGGQELKKLSKKAPLDIEDLITPSEEEIILGTKRTELFFIVRSFFILLAIQGTFTIIKGVAGNDPIGSAYPLLTYLGIIGALILIDSKAKIKNKSLYLGKGFLEMCMILILLLISYGISIWVKPLIALPQIFFAMLLSAGLGYIFSNWRFGPTMKSLLFAGIPVVLAANFLVGGSRIVEAFKIDEMAKVMGYGFFGQLLWMFGGILILIKLGKANHVRNLAPGMAGSLSHSGLTGACTAGDLGHIAAARAPIMINIPFFGHIFVFTILAISAKQGVLMAIPASLVVLCGIVLTYFALKNLRNANGEDAKEVRGLMLFSFGWQLMAVFGSFLLLHLSGITLWNASMATSSAISHFGLFAAVQGGMFGHGTDTLIPFIFAMPFLVHPVVFGMFGKAMKNNGVMSVKPVIIFVILGLIGVIYSLFIM
ncbi:MAG: hypothetical protein OCD02_03565 [Spirochaetaceae bacterium]